MAKTTKIYSNKKGLKETVEESDKPKKKQRIKKFFKKLGPFAKKNWLSLIIIFIVLVGFSFLGIKYMQTKTQLQQLTNPKTAGKTEIQIIEDQVDRVVDIPKDEEPTLATVNDITKLKNQSFFKNAQNGDKLLIYTKSQRALLYRPVQNRVIEYSNVNLQANSQQQNQTQTQGGVNTPTALPTQTPTPAQ